jgi:Domain of unknown function (DUF4288)
MTKARDEKSWYAVHCLYRADHGEQENSRTLLEERLLLIRSEPRSAPDVAQKEAKKREHSYRNERGELIKWKLQQVLSVVEIIGPAIKHGTEIYSRYHLKAKPISTIKRLGFRPGETVFR